MNSIFKTFIAMSALAAVSSTALAEAPSGYYDRAEGLSERSLLVALGTIVGPHTTVSYNGLWSMYKDTDVRPDGTIWDMYSTKHYRYRTDQCGSYSAVGSCYNREHSFPKSWFDDKSPMVSDGYHIYPTDGKVNGQRSNYPFGECAGGTTLPASGGVRALGRLGSSTFPGYSGTVFEPDDEYKGDFARTYFYMAACYNSQIGSWSSPMLAGNNYPAFRPWAIDLLLKWHRQDPVSSKETARNDAVSNYQRNRNPFIDHPELAEYIWGNRKGSAWHASGTPEPAIVVPVDGSTVNIGATATGVVRSASVAVKATDLQADLVLTVSGQGFSVIPARISAADAARGVSATVSFTSATAGSFSGTLTLASGALRSVVTLQCSASSQLPAGPVEAIGEDSFVATWSNIGDADSKGEYVLDVQCDGVSLDEYPRSVPAADERFLVYDLQPSTQYTYTVSSEHLTSAPVTVTTLAPQPRVTFLFDGELNFVAVAGEPSEVAELLVEIENISSDVAVSVSAPFQISTDKSNWSTSLNLSPEEDRLYLRMFGDTPGTYHSSLTAVAGDYRNDQAEFEGTITALVGFHEDFETGNSAGSYSSQQYQGTAFLWNFNNVGIWSGDKVHGGDYAVRVRYREGAYMETAGETQAGVGVVTLWAALYNKDAEATYRLDYSSDGGNTWQSAGTATVSSSTYSRQTFTINSSRPVRLRITPLSGNRFNIDDIEGTAFSGLVPDAVADYHRWDAFCRDGQIVLEAAEPLDFGVTALDGTVIFSGNVSGSLAIPATPGLYIVWVGDFARRVLVK